ncbi:NAD(P)H-hydrate dehydratase [Candidatus Sumerlaeota bacterium]|nr:NAD(P)H-hydrate dehydratase [Candidatus Sumerlaeota bacterium]
MKVFTSIHAQEVDRRTQNEYGIAGFDLMLSAGRAIARRLVSEYPSVRRWCVVCGNGNNGGDGLIVASVLASEYADRGYSADVVFLCSSPDLKGEAAQAWDFLCDVMCKVPSGTVSVRMGVDDLSDRLGTAQGIVDAIFGVGLSRPLADYWADAVNLINQCKGRLPIVAVDVPSGLGDAVRGSTAVHADLTVCVGAPKRCLFAMPDALCAGRIVIEKIQFPDALLSDEEVTENWEDWTELKSWLPPRPLNANKGSFGRLMCVCGSAPYAGAAIFSATAAHRVGTGLVYIATTREQNAIYKNALPESCTIIAPSADPDFLDGQSAEILQRMLPKMNAVVIGPGLGCSDGTQKLVSVLLRDLQTDKAPAVVIDADGLNCIAASVIPFQAQNAEHCVITPHPGEAARLLGKTIDEIQIDRCATARALAKQFSAVVLLKGACTVIARPDAQLWMDNYASPVLSRGGTGDVLSGLIGGLMAQGLTSWKAAVLGCRLLARAGDECCRRMDERGVMIRDLLAALPTVFDEKSK